jgi:hypothetical protein
MISRKPLVIVVTVLWFALAAGLLEAAILLARWGVFGRFTWISVHMAWMAPVANVALLLGPAVIVALGAMVWPRLVPLPFLIGALTLGLVSCLLIVGMNGALAGWAIGLLGLGVAVRIGHQAKKHEEAFSRFFLRSSPYLTALVIILAVLLPGWTMAAEPDSRFFAITQRAHHHPGYRAGDLSQPVRASPGHDTQSRYPGHQRYRI